MEHPPASGVPASMILLKWGVLFSLNPKSGSSHPPAQLQEHLPTCLHVFLGKKLRLFPHKRQRSAYHSMAQTALGAPRVKGQPRLSSTPKLLALKG